MIKQAMKQALLPVLLVSAIALAGCGDNATTQQGDRPAPDATPQKPERNPRQRPADRDPSALAQTPTTNTDPAQPPLGTDANAGRVATLGGVARLPFPDVNERVAQPYPAVRLSNHDPFANEIDPEDIPDIVPWTEAGEYVGYEITVEGRIVNLGQSRDGNVNFLNFDPDWRGKFYMVIFKDLADTLEGGVEGTFLNKLVHVTGEVEDHRGRPQIQILSMDQVEFVDE